MELIGAILVFLAGLSAGALVLLCLKVTRLVEGAEARHAQVLESAEQQHRERLAHADATTAIVVDRMRLVAAGLAAEIREATAAQRNDLRLAVRLPAVRVPGAPAPPRQALPRAPANDAAGRSTLQDDEVTPPAGWTLEQARFHCARNDSTSEEKTL